MLDPNAMSKAPNEARPTHILAAGGLLQRRDGDATLLAVVHRRRYGAGGGAGDFSLPKGKVERGESLTGTAVREVREETGCTGRIVGAPRFTEYEVAGVPKLVVFFPMECVEVGAVADADEVREVLWLTPRAALARLSYPGEREVVAQTFAAS